jgi:hypothetical protein
LSPFNGNKVSPGVGHYFKQTEKVSKPSPKKQPLKLHRNLHVEKPTAGVGDYNIYDINRSISFNKASTVTTKDQRVNYFDLKAVQHIEVPGPGTYDYNKVTKLNKSRSLTIYNTPERPCCSIEKGTNAKGLKVIK